MVVYSTGGGVGGRDKGYKALEAARLLKRRPWGVAGAILLLIMIVIAIFAPLLAPYQPNEIQMQHRLEAPSSAFLFGTDNLGRDILSRVLWGGQIYLRMGLIAVGAAAILGLLLGFFSAYLGRRTDFKLQKALLILFFLGAIVLLFPVFLPGAIYLLFITVGRPAGLWFTGFAIVGPQLSTTLIPWLLAAVFLPSSYNVVRKGVEALRHSRTARRHLLRTLASLAVVVAINLGIAFGMAVLATVPLSYLGFGIAPPAPCWGGMLSASGRQYMLLAPWMVIFPSTAIALASLGLILFGHAVREIWVPLRRYYRLKDKEAEGGE